MIFIIILRVTKNMWEENWFSNIVPSPFSYIDNYDREGDDNNNNADVCIKLLILK